MHIHFCCRGFGAGALRLAALGLLVGFCTATRSEAKGVVFTSTNAVSGNSVVVFDRARDGSLTAAGNVATGGFGTGGGLGNAGALTVADYGRWLLVVNAGSNDISVFKVDGDRLTLTDRVASGGVKPVSITVDDELVYVLNAGGVNNISGFRLTDYGRLLPLANSTRPLSAASVGPAQIGFTPNGTALVVSEKGTNIIDTFLVNNRGIASRPIFNPSAGATPFGFTFDVHGRLFVSEAFGGSVNASAVSSYWIGTDGVLHSITSSSPTHQTAACWVAISQSNAHLWATNTGSGSISAYDLSPDGELRLEGGSGIAVRAGRGGGPTDIEGTPNGRFVYALTPGSGFVEAFRTARDGGLTFITNIGDVGTSATGLVAR